MENYRCGRCQAILTTVAVLPGESFSALLDPLVERRLLATAARHGRECASVGHPDDPLAPPVTETD